MTFSVADFKLKFAKAIGNIDWKLLLLLLFFLNVKLAVKIPVLAIIYLWRFDLKFGFNVKNSRLPLFYLLIIIIGFAGLLVNKNYSDPNYLPVFFTGAGFWLLCLLAVHQVKLSVEQNDAETTHRTIFIFFTINALLSFYNLAHIIWETGAVNPYRYQGEYQKYFIGTGDYIRGVTFDTSTTNAVLNGFGVIYFLTKKNPAMTLVCMAVLLFTGSNFINLALAFVLIPLLVFKSSKDQKSLIVVCLMFLVVFMAKISPQNNNYAVDTFKYIIDPPKSQLKAATVIPKTEQTIATPEDIKQNIAKRYLDSIANAPEQKKASRQPRAITQPILKTNEGKIFIAKADINTPPYQTPTDTTIEERKLLTFIENHKANLPISRRTGFVRSLPGKITAMFQTVNFFQQHPAKIITGDGVGNFSSKLAFRATGLGVAGGYPAGRIYINKDFLINHLDLYLNFFSKRTGLHSLINSPYSVYDQLLAEYGLVGLLTFAICYLGFFARHFKKLTYGLPLLMLMMAAFFIDYWFEQLSVIIVFELFLVLNIKETAYQRQVNYGN